MCDCCTGFVTSHTSISHLSVHRRHVQTQLIQCIGALENRLSMYCGIMRGILWILRIHIADSVKILNMVM